MARDELGIEALTNNHYDQSNRTKVWAGERHMTESLARDAFEAFKRGELGKAKSISVNLINHQRVHIDNTPYSRATMVLATHRYASGDIHGGFSDIIDLLKIDHRNKLARSILLAFLSEIPFAGASDTKLVFGLGTGRSGSTSLTSILQKIPKSYVSHECPSRIWWGGDEETVKWHLERMKLISGSFSICDDVSHWWLPYSRFLLNSIPNAVFLAVKRSKDQTVQSFVRLNGGDRKGSINHWSDHDGTFYRKTKWFNTYPKYKFASMTDCLAAYWEDYYDQCEVLSREFPNRFAVIPIEELNEKSQVNYYLKKLGIPEIHDFSPVQLNKETTSDGMSMVPSPFLSKLS